MSRACWAWLGVCVWVGVGSGVGLRGQNEGSLFLFIFDLIYFLSCTPKFVKRKPPRVTTGIIYPTPRVYVVAVWVGLVDLFFVI